MGVQGQIRRLVWPALAGLLVLTAAIAGCDSQKAQPTLSETHPASWMDTTSIDFHGRVALNSGLQTCAKCHGSDWKGKSTGVSCLDCHGLGKEHCSACHGGLDNRTGAPPYGLRGETAARTLAVGAHTVHVTGSGLAGPVACNSCHIVPVFAWDSTHFDFSLPNNRRPVDSIAEVTFGAIAGANRARWDRSERTCARTYCHGSFVGGDSGNTPVWTGSNQAACGSCHDVGSNPSTLKWKHAIHLQGAGLHCGDCHAGVIDTSGTIVGPALHVNGTADTLTRDPAVCRRCHGSGAGSCTLCHGGTDNESGAPPRGLHNESATSARAVGAHTRHFEGGLLADGVACNECHLVPRAAGDPGHMAADSIAELIWGPLAGSQSNWNRVSLTCASTYCHGNFSGGNSANAPVWTEVNQAACGTCHDTGIMPASLGWKHATHVTVARLKCADCHASVVDTAQAIIGKPLHVNGVVDTLTRDRAVCNKCHGPGSSSCTLCHGGMDDASGAPPKGLHGETATTDRAVGAHALHLSGGALTDGMACDQCHVVPRTMSDPGHLGADSIAEVAWGALAGSGAVWERNARTCASTYCHGNFRGGAHANTTVWTGTNQASCGSCHDVGRNPASLGWKHETHVIVAGLKCANCHASVVDAQQIITGKSLHVNGVADTLIPDRTLCDRCHGAGPGSCTGCHGGTDNQTGAPPKGLRGETSTTTQPVGTHTQHLTGGALTDGIACDECHLVPTSLSSPGHLGTDSVAELTWGTLAGSASIWNPATNTCGATYCHGNFSGGNTGNSPVWTADNQAACGSCHDVGSNPASLGWKHATHLTIGGLKCADCHASVVDTLQVIIGRPLHVNGVVDTLVRNRAACDRCHGSGGGSCTLCHGSTDNQTGAPPRGLRGESDRTDRAVGAHTRHLSGGTIAHAMPCGECHVVPATAADPGHIAADSIAELAWGPLAGTQSTWNRTAMTCASTYCHGRFTGGNNANIPVWTAAGPAACGSCHDAGANPVSLGWKHSTHVTDGGLRCADCHASVVDTALNVIGLNLHVNGVVDTLIPNRAICDRCHGSGPGSCTLCHGGADNQTGAPPRGLHGEIAISDRAVGAHTRHLTGDTLTDGIPCRECHVIPSAMTDPGHLGTDSIAELSWGPLAGPLSSWDRVSKTCGQTYCHGTFAGGKNSNTPIWTATDQATCGSCHDTGSNPSQLGWKHDIHVASGLRCADCHAAVVDTTQIIIGKSLHVNGVPDTLTRDPAVCDRCHGPGRNACTLCHGGMDNETGAPPRGLRGETTSGELSVGAHTKHLNGGTTAHGFACRECHVVPSVYNSPGHLGLDSVAEMNWGTLAGSQSNWDRTARSCASTYCHGNFTGGATGNAPVWTGSNQAACGSCHDVGSNPSLLGWKHSAHVTGAGLKCADCHSAVVDTGLAIVGLNLHVNGVVDTLIRDRAVCDRCHGSGASPCTMCHGGADNLTGAPPRGLHGETATSSRAVGAHTRHLSGGPLSSGMACRECHIVPVTSTDPGHIGVDSVAELTWGTLSGPLSNWNRTARTCSSTYCHGNFTGGKNSNMPVWTGTNQAACGSCHDAGSNPASLGWKHEAHVTGGGLRCAECHASVVDTLQKIIGKPLHVNGVVDTLTRDQAVCDRCHGSGTGSCTMCHGGTDNQTGAPPIGLRGELATTDRAVGAHTKHLSGGLTAHSFACGECHSVPLSFSDPGHFGADSIAELTWGPLAGPLSSWNRTARTCGSTYCHGKFTGGNIGNTPVWTGSNQASCGSCHDVGSNPALLGWKHDVHMNWAGLECADCHSSVVDTLQAITNLNLHVNGVVDTLTRNQVLCNRCHGPGKTSCTMCHGGIDDLTGAPPTGLRGELLTSDRAVGAHSRHLTGGTTSHAFACLECHTVPSTYNASGHLGADSIAEMIWGTLAGSQSSWNRTARTCASTYCHGEFTGGNNANAPVWTGTNQAACGSCHDAGSNPASLGWKHDVHVTWAGLTCADCHSSVVDTLLAIKNLNLHVNGVVDTLTRNQALCNRCHGPGKTACTMCHGGADNLTGAPPSGLRGELLPSDRAIGAHSKHLSGGTIAHAFACTECHVVPATYVSAGHLGTDSIAEMTWGPLAKPASIWNRTANTCASTYCHGNFSGGTTANTPVWTGTNQAACGSCHDVGANPTLLGGRHRKHVVSEGLGCFNCHATTVDAAKNIIGPAVHVDGQFTVKFAAGTGTYSGGTCTEPGGCHGNENWY